MPYKAGPVFAPARSSLFAYLKNTQIFVCPSDSQGLASLNSYAINSYAINSCVHLYGNEASAGADIVNDYHIGLNLASFSQAASWMLLSEEGEPSDNGASTDDGYQLQPGNDYTARHLAGSNVAFLDGHVKWLRPEKRSAFVTAGLAPALSPPDNAGGVCPF